MMPPPQTEPPSAPVPEKSTLGTSVFQATQPPSNSGAVTVFSLKSFVCCRNQPPVTWYCTLTFAGSSQAPAVLLVESKVKVLVVSALPPAVYFHRPVIDSDVPPDPIW